MRSVLSLLALLACLSLQSCSTAAPPGASGQAPAPLAAAPALPSAEVPPPGVPAGRAATSTAAGEVDYSCRTDADCAVKDVGNCCGYYPACVNVDSPTFPDQVKAQCEREGMSAICGFPVIESCACRAGRCQPGGAGAAVE